MRPPRTLAGRIALAHVATTLVALIGLSLVCAGLLRSVARSLQDHQLVLQTESLAARLRRDGAGRVVLSRRDGAAQMYANRFDGRAFAVIDAAGHTALAGNAAALPPRYPRTDNPRVHYFQVGSTVAAILPVDLQGQRLLILSSQDLSYPGAVSDNVERRFVTLILVLLAPVLGGLLIVDLLIIRRWLRPVAAVTASAAAIGPERFDLRLNAAPLPTDIVPLALAVNRALDRLEASYRAQTEFVANVAHELRTPIAALRLRLDGLPEGEPRRAIARSIDRLSHVVAQLLDLAGLEGAQPEADERFDLADAAREAVASVALYAESHGKRLRFAPEDGGAEVVGRRALAQIAIVNLIENAVRHTPPGTRIEVMTRALSVTVRDDGPGVDRVAIDLSGDRFRRRDRQRSGGAGIGLSIVQRIMAVLGGTLGVDDPPDGGAAFTLCFRRDS